MKETLADFPGGKLMVAQGFNLVPDRQKFRNIMKHGRVKWPTGIYQSDSLSCLRENHILVLGIKEDKIAICGIVKRKMYVLNLVEKRK